MAKATAARKAQVAKELKESPAKERLEEKLYKAATGKKK